MATKIGKTNEVKTCLLVEKGDEHFMLVNQRWYHIKIGVDYFTKPFLESSTAVVTDEKLKAELYEICGGQQCLQST